MKTYLLTLFCVLPFCSQVALAAQKALTDEGKVVILNSDGTWRYENPEAQSAGEIKLNQGTFKKDSSATFLLKSTKNKVGIWFNPALWTFKKGEETGPAEYRLELKGKDLYGMVITEQVEMATENLVEVALENAKGAAPDAHVVAKEYRMVNGTKVIYQRMDGTIKGIKFTYFGYYFGGKGGSTQLIVYTGSSLIEKYRTEIDNLLNGFAIQP